MTHAVSATGLELLKEYEGFRSEPTQLPDGNWVVGYSHVRVGDAGDAMTLAEAGDVLALDLAPYERLVNARVTADLNQSQFDALVSFAFSIGAEEFEKSQVLRRVNAGDFVAAACAMDAWRKSDASGELEVVDALVRRRAAEKALFLKDMAHDAAPSVFMRAKLDYAASVLGAPVKYAPAPDVSQARVVQPAAEPAARISEILKSEPATEALLLTQVVPDDVEDEGEIVTAHAKPVARTLDNVREATRRAYAEQNQGDKKRGLFGWFKREEGAYHCATPEFKPDRRIRSMRAHGHFMQHSSYYLGPVALLVFGLGLISIGGALLFGGRGDMIEIAGAVALTTPGLAAVLMAAFGLWKNPREKHAAA